MASSDYSSLRGESSPDGRTSPIPNTNSSPSRSMGTGSRRSTRGRRRTPAASPFASSPSLGVYQTPPPPPRPSAPAAAPPSIFSTPSSSRRRWQTPSTPMSTDENLPPSSDTGDDDVDPVDADSTPVFVWGTQR